MPLNKRITTLRSKVDRDKSYPAQEGLQLVKETATAKFDESVDAVINLGIDAKKSDQLIREAAKAAGADIVGFDDLAEKIKGGMMDFDVVIATPDAMKVVGALGQVLGPRGLMPNPKVGTVTPDTAAAVKNAKGGQVQYRTDKGGIVHCTIGRASFSVDQLKGNLVALVDAINKAKPPTTKGIFVKKLSVSSTMGAGVRIDSASLV
ncbi:MAG: hypothetical protein RLZZ583_540 [Pseudomonadota bacterium]